MMLLQWLLPFPLLQGVGSHAIPQSPSVTSVQQSSPGEGSSSSAGPEKSASKHESSSHLASATAVSKPSPVVSDKTKEHQPKGPQSETHTTSSSLDRSPPSSTSVVVAGAPGSRPPTVISEKARERQPKESQSESHTTSSSFDRSPPSAIGVVVAGVQEDTQVKTKSPSPELKHEDTTEPIAESKEPPVEPKIPLAEIHQEYEGLPQKQHTPMTRLKLTDKSSLSSFGSMTSIYSEAGGKGDYDITGEVLVGVYYKNGQLYIHVERARGLAAADSNGYSDPYIKTYLLPDKAKHTKQKTSVKKKTLSPVYNETLKVR